MKKTLLLLLTIYLVTCTTSLFAQEFPYFGSPFISQYLPKDYNGSSQNWGIAQDKKGVMYVAGSDAMLEFDGTTWRKYYVTNKSVIRLGYRKITLFSQRYYYNSTIE